MSIYEAASEVERRVVLTEVRVREGGIVTGDSLGPRGSSLAMARQPTVINFNAYQGGIINYNVSNVQLDDMRNPQVEIDRKVTENNGSHKPKNVRGKQLAW